jgi:folate-binding protein YgfZ
MNTEWEKFLSARNATLKNNHIENFGHSITEEQEAFSNLVLADLSHYALIKASGEDVIDFLQGQFTNDIKLVSDNLSQLSAYCNPKGRILANFRVFKRDEDFILRLHEDILEPTLKRLRMFVMRSKVELLDSSDELMRIGIAGENASTKLSAIFTRLPENTDEAVTENDTTIIKLAGTVPRYEVYGPLEMIKSLWETLEKDAVNIGKNSWDLLTIRAGIPEIVTGTVEAFVPQMVNLQAINSLSFTKGCYPGQEVVARMHYLGKVKRRLYIASAETDTLPIPGQSIVTGAESEEKAGQIVMASWSGDNIVELLAVLIIEKAENEALHIESHAGPSLTLADLPYSLEKDEK